MWRRHKLETHRGREFELVQVDEERVQIVPCVRRALGRCGGPPVHITSQVMSMRGGCEVKSGVQIIVHSRRGMRKADWGGDQRELRSAKRMVVVEERKRRRGGSVLIWGGLLGQKPVPRKLPAISQEGDEGADGG